MIEDILKEKKNMTSGEERIADYFLDKKLYFINKAVVLLHLNCLSTLL